MAKFLVGLRNKGQFDFIVETLDATLRYPLDYNYVIRNVNGVDFLFKILIIFLVVFNSENLSNYFSEH